MDLKVVIRQLLEKGLTREQVIGNLKELGVSDAEKLFDEAVGTQAQKQAPVQEKPSPAKGLFKEISEPAPQVRQQPQERKEAAQQAGKKKGETEISIMDLMETQGKSLFKKTQEKLPELEKPEFEVVGRKKKQEEPAEEEEKSEAEIKIKTPPSPEPQNIEEKIDEALALLKALENINQKILETDRKILLRSKE